jgi:hypothetical protein
LHVIEHERDELNALLLLRRAAHGLLHITRRLLGDGTTPAAVEYVDAEHETQHERDERSADAHPAPTDHSATACLPPKIVEISAAPAGCPTHGRSSSRSG